jgi:hypothetical protein
VCALQELVRAEDLHGVDAPADGGDEPDDESAADLRELDHGLLAHGAELGEHVGLVDGGQRSALVALVDELLVVADEIPYGPIRRIVEALLPEVLGGGRFEEREGNGLPALVTLGRGGQRVDLDLPLRRHENVRRDHPVRDPADHDAAAEQEHRLLLAVAHEEVVAPARELGLLDGQVGRRPVSGDGQGLWLLEGDQGEQDDLFRHASLPEGEVGEDDFHEVRLFFRLDGGGQGQQHGEGEEEGGVSGLHGHSPGGG